jgi:hypothetical protein
MPEKMSIENAATPASSHPGLESTYAVETPDRSAAPSKTAFRMVAPWRSKESGGTSGTQVARCYTRPPEASKDAFAPGRLLL